METMTKEAIIQKYATNEYQVDYVEFLGESVFENVAEIVEDIENDDREILFKEILDIALTDCIIDHDNETQNVVEENFPFYEYIRLTDQEGITSKWTIEMSKDGSVAAEITMSPETHIIMSLTKQLEKLERRICSEGVAQSVKFINHDNGEEY